MKPVNIDTVAATMRVFIDRSGEAVIYNDPANGETLRIGAGAAGATDGLLPAIVVAGESVWRDLTGKGFKLDLVRDPTALLGYRLHGIGDANFSIVMLASIEALHQAKRPEGIVVNEFNALWASAAQRELARADSTVRATAGAAP
ncbi:hypothetical protein GCM10010909_12700 [Acidocella aquatica]|uniref:Uncharacterized protein n=1 Tax=Acidocella aquatica TaxID=1922313 RepID=A0ABQ6A937_9PROT|nr:hypothetical protein [Acidocella aquatica]GLR66590.1 hypothetical protein GCM10010909_12700 [Acidocella aquatica]